MSEERGRGPLEQPGNFGYLASCSREIAIRKFAGSNHSKGFRSYEIDSTGLHVEEGDD